MSFGLNPASAFTDNVTLVDATWLNFVRAALPDCLDAVAGGTYNILAGHTIDFPAGGGGWTFECNVDLTHVGTLDVYTALLIESGATETVAGALIVTGTETIALGAAFNIYGTATLEVGAALDVFGAVLVEADGGIALLGTSGHPASLLLEAWSVLTMSSNAALSAGAGTAVTLAGTNIFSGTNTLSGVTTQTAAYAKIGNSATTQERTKTFATSQTIDGSQFDLILYYALGAPTITLTLTDPTINGLRVRVAASNTAGMQTTGTLLIHNSGGSLIGTLGPGIGGGGAFMGTGFADYESVGLVWICVASIGGG